MRSSRTRREQEKQCSCSRSSTRTSMLLALVLVLLCCCCSPVVEAKKKAAEVIDSKGQPGPGGVVERTVPLRTHSIYAPYVDSDLQNRWFDFGGDAIVNTNRHIRLTQDRKSQAGWLWSRLPLTPTSFEIEFEFRVDGSSNNLYGDGFALWLTRDRARPGPVFGSSDRWDGLGVFFDTYANARHSYAFPEIVAILNDGTKTYDNGKDGAGQEAGRCSIDFRRTEVTAKGKLTYFKNQFLQLQIQHEEWDKWTECFNIPDVNLPSTIYMGFSAHTGDVADEHDIISISTHNVVWHAPTGGNQGKTKSKSRFRGGSGGSSSNGRGSSSRNGSGGGGGGFGGFLYSLVKWLFFGVVAVIGVIAFRGWRMRKSAKRF